jgi:hypothetical protein
LPVLDPQREKRRSGRLGQPAKKMAVIRIE